MLPDPRLRALAEDIALRHNAHVVELVQRGDRSRQVVEVYLDNETGVTVELCSEVSRELINTVDAGRILEGNYRLEVSSPGIDRPLHHSWQYIKHVGRILRVRRQSPEGVAEVRGKLVGVQEAGILLHIGEGDTMIPFTDIQDARVQAPW